MSGAPMNEDRARAWIDTYTRGELDACMAFYADDVVFEDPIFAERVEGKAALRANFARFFHSGVTKLRFLRWSGGEAGGAVEWQWTADWGPERSFLGFDASNRRFVTRGVSALALRGGLIVRQADYWDARSALIQLGALPPRD